jgi:hypothetical protein
MNDTLTVNTVRFVDAADIILTFGDNEYSLITPEHFKQEMLDIAYEDIVDADELKKIEEVLTALDQEGILINI